MPDSTKSQRIIIACGGTGGHLFPGIAIAQELRSLGHRPLLLISRKQVDSAGSGKYPDLEFRAVPAIAKPPTWSLRMIIFLWRFICTLLSSLFLVWRERADAVLGMGGFTSLAPVMAGFLLRRRTYVHDSNAIPGRANRLTARFCTLVLLGMKEAANRLPGCPCRTVGTPVRRELLDAPTKEEARKQLALPVDKPLLLVTGGSQGARQLNTTMVEAAKATPQIQFLIIAGEADRPRVEELAVDVKNVKVIGFCSEMPTAYAAADAVVARSGASTLTELSVLGKACLLVPYPYAADNHQYYNARIVVEAGAGELCRQEELTQERTLNFLNHTLLNPSALEAMQTAMHSLAKPEAAHTIASIVANTEEA